MTLRTRLTLFFTAVVATLLLLFCVIIYVVTEQYRAREFRERLREEAQTAAELLLGNDPVGPDLLRMLDQHHMTVLDQESMRMYNGRDQLVHKTGQYQPVVSTSWLEQVRRTGDVYRQEGQRDVVGITYTVLAAQYVVVASAVDKYGLTKQYNLALILGLGWVVGIGVVMGTGWVFAGRSLKPLQYIIARIDATTASQLNLRLSEGTNNDELTQLTRQFNRMLDRLEEAFQMQRSFVANASHELRTPLTAITGQLDVALLANDDDPQELRALIASVLDDVRGLNQLTNGLLSLAKLDLTESTQTPTPVSVASLLHQLRLDLLRLHPDYQIDIDLDTPIYSNPDRPIAANRALLQTAFYNLMENGGKYAPDHRVCIRLVAHSQAVEIRFTNNGPCIPATEQAAIFEPFRRGTNVRQVAGHGIGLSLTRRIVQLHGGQISVQSTPETGTTFTVTLPG